MAALGAAHHLFSPSPSRAAELEEERAGLRVELRHEKDTHQVERSQRRKLQRELDELKAAMEEKGGATLGAADQAGAAEATLTASDTLPPSEAPATAAAAVTETATSDDSLRLLEENTVLKEEIARLTAELDKVRSQETSIVSRNQEYSWIWRLAY